MGEWVGGGSECKEKKTKESLHRVCKESKNKERMDGNGIKVDFSVAFILRNGDKL